MHGKFRPIHKGCETEDAAGKGEQPPPDQGTCQGPLSQVQLKEAATSASKQMLHEIKEQRPQRRLVQECGIAIRP